MVAHIIPFNVIVLTIFGEEYHFRNSSSDDCTSIYRPFTSTPLGANILPAPCCQTLSLQYSLGVTDQLSYPYSYHLPEV
jgi:hypothetical protein